MRRHSLPTLFAGLCLASAANAADLTIELVGVRSDAGNLMIAVYDSAATFRQVDHAAASVRLRARASARQVTLSDLPEGSYAIAVYHDENQNQKLDTNLVGIPTEATGFSNDAAASFGPPDFEAAKLVLGGSPVHVRVTLE